MTVKAEQPFLFLLPHLRLRTRMVSSDTHSLLSMWTTWLFNCLHSHGIKILGNLPRKLKLQITTLFKNFLEVIYPTTRLLDLHSCHKNEKSVYREVVGTFLLRGTNKTCAKSPHNSMLPQTIFRAQGDDSQVLETTQERSDWLSC